MSRTTAWTALICCLLLWHTPSQAIDNIAFQIGHWAFKDYAAQQFDLSVRLTDSGLQLDAAVEKLSLPAPWGELQKAQLNCDQTRLLAGTWQCLSGRLIFQHARLGKQNLAFKIKAHPQQESYQLDIKGLRIAEANLNIVANYQPSGWKLSLSADKLSLQALSEWLPLLLGEDQLEALSDWEYQGRVRLNAELEGKQQQLNAIRLDWQASELGFSNKTGTQVAEGVTLAGQLKGSLSRQQWHWQLALETDNGQVYSDPVFLDLKQHPLSVSGKGTVDSDFNALQLAELHIDQQAVLSADARLNWANARLESLRVTIRPAELADLYSIWLQPFALGTAAAKMQISGQVAIEFDWQQGQYQLRLGFDQASLNDEEGRFKLQNLNGKFGWTNTETKLETALNWSQAKLYAVDLGEAAIRAESINSSLALTDALNLPVLDGSLQVNAFHLQQKPDGHVDWGFDGLLMPISMESLSQALDWPMLHGKLSGVIPRVSYSNQQLKIDGALQVKVFDGTTVIRDLRLSSPFGSLPQLYANIDINNLDLELLTRTFDFGRITGRLEGYVHNLRLSNWEPVQFDATLATPKTNPGKRRISQKAVDNLTQIGGGATGMLSRSFLRFFEDFSYQKLGLSCHLQNEVCEMSGIEEAEQGYYIVKGGGGLPPWINVIGYTRRVDWADLIARILAVRDSSGPVIQ